MRGPARNGRPTRARTAKLTKNKLAFFFSGKIREKEVCIMAYRKTVKPKTDKKVFTNTAKKTKKINISPKPSRGGIRL